MNAARLTLALFLAMAIGDLTAQDCSISFTTPQFAVRQELDILYGSGVRFNGATQELRLNLFKPIGDAQTERPLIIMVHGGGFTGGDRNDLNA
ncbi:MAG: hypothetical protein KDB84_10260, partial [Flavobacteriales bacterium]|nr:hypothetical protein [Flavobacteriales bacterium]